MIEKVKGGRKRTGADIPPMERVLPGLRARLDPVFEQAGLSEAERAAIFALVENSFGPILEKRIRNSPALCKKSLPEFLEKCPQEIWKDQAKLVKIFALAAEMLTVMQARRYDKNCVRSLFELLPGLFKTHPRMLGDNEKFSLIFDAAIQGEKSGGANRRGGTVYFFQYYFPDYLSRNQAAGLADLQKTVNWYFK
jgi:hypothetical protein